jgi:hypothetical protein
MITIRCFVGAPPSPGRSNEPSLVEIARSLNEAEERLAALAPYTPLAEPYVRELREIRRQVAALMTDSVTPPTISRIWASISSTLNGLDGSPLASRPQRMPPPGVHQAVAFRMTMPSASRP